MMLRKKMLFYPLQYLKYSKKWHYFFKNMTINSSKELTVHFICQMPRAFDLTTFILI